MTRKKPDCVTCEDDGRKGYCARGRCYCGHPACHGYESWSPLPEPVVVETVPVKPTPRASAWDDREKGSSWIDQL